MLLVVYVISQLTSTWLMSTSMQSAAQRWMIMLLPIVFIPFILGFPSGLMIYWLTTNLWTTGQGLITRRQMPRPVAPPKRSSRTPPKEDVPAAEIEPAVDGTSGGRRGSHRASTQGQAEEGRRAKAMTSDTDVRVEASGETVGEAKWSALRELEQLVPGLDREQVEFEIVSEGERGLLGVGYTPARVIASAANGGGADVVSTGSASEAREFVARIAEVIGADVTVSAGEREGVVTVTCSGEDLGLFIGKHGQTIDAIQYLANAVTRTEGHDYEIVVDAAGYRARRNASLEAVAIRSARQAATTQSAVELDPMTSVERKIVHEALKDDPEVETQSEGSEPHRYVVVLPRSSAD